LVVLLRVPEPAGADRDVRFAGPPRAAVRVAGAQQGARPRAVGTGVRHAGRVHAGPAGFAGRALLVADPAHVGAGVGEHHGVGLQLAHGGVDARPVVGLLAAVRAFAVGAVEPHFHDLAVVGEQLGELGDVEIVVGRAAAVALRVAVPRRQVEACAQAFSAAGVGELAHHIAMAVVPRAVFHRVLRGGGGPQAEAVVVLGGEDHAAEAGLLRRARPLPRVQL